VLVDNAGALEVEYRWTPTHWIHPVASASLASGKTEYVYRTAKTASCQNQYCSAHGDSAESYRAGAVAGGAELNLTSWLHITLLGGYRDSFANSTPATASNSGFTLSSLIMFGTPYRVP
jgi:hypothetical protein